MRELLRSWFADGGFMPHVHCYLGRPSLVWTMFATDLLIGTAYLGISVTLLWLVRRVEISFNPVVLCFGTFIAACGATHYLEVWTLWFPDYWWAAAVKVLTALASVGTGLYLYRLRHPIVTVAEAARLSEQRRLDLEVLTGRLEHLVEERTRKLQLALDATGLGLWEYRPADGQVRWDERMVRMFGFENATFEGTYQAFLERVHEGDRRRVASEVEETLHGGGHFTSEYRIRRPDGSVRWIAAHGQSLGANGALVAIGTALDVTSRRVAEEALQQAVRARDEFISVASHELKTPLTSIGIQVQLLDRTLQRRGGAAIDTTLLGRALAITSRQLTRLSRLVDDMLDISRIATGHLVYEMAEHDLGAAVREALDRLSYDLESAGCTLHTDLEPGIKARVDLMRIEQVVGNLVGNATKYAAGRPIEVALRRDGDRAVLAVHDHGPGVPPEAQHRIFERFERAHEGSEVSGLGLGLYIVRRIVEAHGGRISLRSEVGQGATFLVELPLACGAAASVRPVHADGSGEPMPDDHRR